MVPRVGDDTHPFRFTPIVGIMQNTTVVYAFLFIWLIWQLLNGLYIIDNFASLSTLYQWVRYDMLVYVIIGHGVDHIIFEVRIKFYAIYNFLRQNTAVQEQPCFCLDIISSNCVVSVWSMSTVTFYVPPKFLLYKKNKTMYTKQVISIVDNGLQLPSCQYKFALSRGQHLNVIFKVPFILYRVQC